MIPRIQNADVFKGSFCCQVVNDYFEKRPDVVKDVVKKQQPRSQEIKVLGTRLKKQ